MTEVNDISVLVMAVERLAEAQSKTNEKVDKLVESMGKQEVILEKLANIEKNHADSIKRVFHQMDLHISERKEEIARLNKKLDIIEGYMLHDGCPAHKNFKIGYDMRAERLTKAEQAINDELEKLSTRVQQIEDQPKVALGKVGNAVLAVFGTAIGGWLIVKFGLQ